MEWRNAGQFTPKRSHVGLPPGAAVVFATTTPAWGKALTRGVAGPYHGRMTQPNAAHAKAAKSRHKMTLLVLLLTGLACGCDDSGKRPVQARIPAQAPQSIDASAAMAASNGHGDAASAQTIAGGASLPLTNPAARPSASLLPAIPKSKAYLAQRVEEKFASGEQNYKAGHLEAARKDFNDAVDWMLESGYDPASDARLNELFHRVVDTVYGEELQAFRAGDGFSEPPAVPAAIDEVAEMTFPVDPRLKDRAEESAKNISHDLPLTVNDEVLSFLNFFQTTRGKAIVETGLRRAGPYREMISRVLREEGVPQRAPQALRLRRGLQRARLRHGLQAHGAEGDRPPPGQFRLLHDPGGAADPSREG